MNDPQTSPETLISYSLHDKIVKGLEAKIDRWEEIQRDELGCTLTLMASLGVTADVKAGKACMDAMLQRISDYQNVVWAARCLLGILPPGIDTAGRLGDLQQAIERVTKKAPATDNKEHE